MKKCPVCGKVMYNNEDNYHCNTCGKRIYKIKECPRCGSALYDNDNNVHCAKCGYRKFY